MLDALVDRAPGRPSPRRSSRSRASTIASVRWLRPCRAALTLVLHLATSRHPWSSILILPIKKALPGLSFSAPPVATAVRPSWRCAPQVRSRISRPCADMLRLLRGKIVTMAVCGQWQSAGRRPAGTGRTSIEEIVDGLDQLVEVARAVKARPVGETVDRASSRDFEVVVEACDGAGSRILCAGGRHGGSHARPRRSSRACA